MSVSAQETAVSSGAAGRVLRALLVILAVGQLVGSLLVNQFGGQFTTADRVGEPPIVPVGWAFSIWSVVIALSVGYAAWAQPATRPDRQLRDRLARPLLVVFAGFSGWLVAAEVEPTWTTLVMFAVILGALLRAIAIALAHRAVIASWSPVGRGLLWGLLGTYTGWSSIAIWVNVATAFAGSGAPLTGPAGTAGQVAILAGATATAVAIVRFTAGLLPYAAAAVWALGTAALGAAEAGQPVLGLIAAGGLAAVLVVLGATRSRRRHSSGANRWCPPSRSAGPPAQSREVVP